MTAPVNIKLLRARLHGWLSSSISNRITFAALSLAMMVALVLGLASFGTVAVLVKHSIKAELDGQARLTLQKLQGDLDALSSDLATMSGNSFIANGLVDSLGRDTYLLPFLHEHQSPVAFRTSIVLCDFRGRPIASNASAMTLPDQTRHEIQQVLATGKPSSELLKLAQGSFLVLVQPVIFPPTGQAEGALVETVNLQALCDSGTRHIGMEYRVRLLANGLPLAHQSQGEAERGMITVQHRLALAEPLKSLDLAFQIGLSCSSADRPLKLLALVYLLFGIALLALVLKFAQQTARRLTQPLISLSMTASRIAASGSLDLSAEVSGSDEVGTLANVFNEMLKKLRASHDQLESQVENRTRQLKDAHDLLENRVAQRTSELTEANLRLEREKETKMQLEEQLRQVQKMEAIGTLAGGIAHDFNNILTVIGSYSALTGMQMSDSDPLKKNMDHIMTATDKAANLTRSLLAFSRKQVMNSQDTELNSIVRNVENFLKRVIGEDILLGTSLCAADRSVHLDQGQMEQVLMNLASNARDAMPKGGVMMIETSMQELDDAYVKAYGHPPGPGRYALITVSDSGCGMDRETVTKIFEPFYTTKEVGKGTGLGLAMVYGIVKQHNGHITVYSEPGEGTTFKIYLPALAGPPDAASERRMSTAPPAGGTETVLVAEDDAEVREVVKKVLGESGYRVIFAVDGQDAVNKFRENLDQIRLVILDMIMPKKSGREAYDEIRQLEPGARVLFASGYTADFVQSRGDLHEGADLVMKPVHPSELLRKVREMLDR